MNSYVKCVFLIFCLQNVVLSVGPVISVSPDPLLMSNYCLLTGCCNLLPSTTYENGVIANDVPIPDPSYSKVF